MLVRNLRDIVLAPALPLSGSSPPRPTSNPPAPPGIDSDPLTMPPMVSTALIGTVRRCSQATRQPQPSVEPTGAGPANPAPSGDFPPRS
jgi:hypothetical protein